MESTWMITTIDTVAKPKHVHVNELCARVSGGRQYASFMWTQQLSSVSQGHRACLSWDAECREVFSTMTNWARVSRQIVVAAGVRRRKSLVRHRLGMLARLRVGVDDKASHWSPPNALTLRQVGVGKALQKHVFGGILHHLTARCVGSSDHRIRVSALRTKNRAMFSFKDWHNRWANISKRMMLMTILSWPKIVLESTCISTNHTNTNYNARLSGFVRKEVCLKAHETRNHVEQAVKYRRRTNQLWNNTGFGNTVLIQVERLWPGSVT